jgi:hypothetical protein
VGPLLKDNDFRASKALLFTLLGVAVKFMKKYQLPMTGLIKSKVHSLVVQRVLDSRVSSLAAVWICSMLGHWYGGQSAWAVVVRIRADRKEIIIDFKMFIIANSV